MSSKASPRLVRAAVVLFAFFAVSAARAEDGGVRAEDGGATWSMVAPFASTSAAPSAAPVPRSPDAPRPPPGPSVHERGSRARRSNPAAGPLFLVILIGAMAYYVIKKVRRR